MASVSLESVSQYLIASDKYFLDSGDKIRYFFEEGVFDKYGNLNVKKETIEKLQ